MVHALQCDTSSLQPSYPVSKGARASTSDRKQNGRLGCDACVSAASALGRALHAAAAIVVSAEGGAAARNEIARTMAAPRRHMAMREASAVVVTAAYADSQHDAQGVTGDF